MKQVSIETVDKTILWLESLEDESEMETLIDEFGNNQSLLLAYLMNMGEDDLNEDERELLLFLGIFFWKALLAEGIEVAEVTEDKLEDLRMQNLALLEAAEHKQGADFEQVWKNETQDYSQKELLNYLLENLEDEIGYSLREKNRKLLQSFAKIALDSLI